MSRPVARCRSAEIGGAGSAGSRSSRLRPGLNASARRGAGDGGFADRPGIEGPQHLEPAVGFAGGLLAGKLPAGQADGVAPGLAHQDPFTAQRRSRRNGNLGRRAGGPAGLREVGEDHDGLGGPGQLVPAVFRLPVKTLPLEAGEQQRALGPGASTRLRPPGSGPAARPCAEPAAAARGDDGAGRRTPTGPRPGGRPRPGRSPRAGSGPRRAAAGPPRPGQCRAHRNGGGPRPSAGDAGSHNGFPSCATSRGAVPCVRLAHRW